MKRAESIFQEYGMYKTKDRNGILIYVSFHNKVISIFGDVGINDMVSEGFWEQSIKECIEQFTIKRYCEGLVDLILKMGEKLKLYFPFCKESDANELSNEILFGKD